jgi:hypothetical protein
LSYVVEVSRRVRVRQGLPSPVRERRGLPPVPPGQGVEVTVTAGVTFEDDRLDDLGRFFDTDAVGEVLDEVGAALAGRPWVAIFDFRPTFELVARHLFGELAPRIPGLAFVALTDETFGVTTRYLPPAVQEPPAG